MLMTGIIPIRWQHVNRRAIIAFPHSSPLPQPAAGSFLAVAGIMPEAIMRRALFSAASHPNLPSSFNSHGGIP
jgi:hypothetical protein